MEKSSIVRHTGGGGNEPQGREDFWLKLSFSKLKFSVSEKNNLKNNVSWGFNPNKNNEFQKSNSCHPQKCSSICTQKSNVGLKAQPTSTAFTLAEVFSLYYYSPRKIAFTLAEVLITLGII